MKVGIFGDSFAMPGSGGNLRNFTLSWPEIIAQKYDTSFNAKPGSCLLHSVKKLKEFHSKYDKIVFVVTNPGRFEFNQYVESHCNKKFEWEYLRRVQGLFSIEQTLSRLDIEHPDLDPVIKEAWLSALSYFKYIQEEEDDTYFHNLMLDDIKRTRPDVILIPGFPDSFPDQKPVASMFSIQVMENEHWGLTSGGATRPNDIRKCHMTAENNEIFANNVFKWLNGEPVVINLADYKKPTEPMSKYFIQGN